jgi:hypothetical protein
MLGIEFAFLATSTNHYLKQYKIKHPSKFDRPTTYWVNAKYPPKKKFRKMFRTIVSTQL